MSVSLAFLPQWQVGGLFVWEIFKGEASQINAGLSNANVQKAYKWMLICVSSWLV